MGEVAGIMTRKRKKKGRPSLLDLQKRSLKQQQQQRQQQNQGQNPNTKSPVPFNSHAISNSRSTRRNAFPNGVSPDSEWIGGDGDDEEEEEDDDERKEKKHRLLLGLNSHNNHHHYPNLCGSVSNGDAGENPEADLKRRKISAVRRGSGAMDEKVAKATDTLHGSPVETGPTTPLPDKKLLVFVLDRLQKKDTYGVFSEPVDPDELPDYHDIIEHPMDFSTVRKKLDRGGYSSLEEFEKDVFLICSNAMQYNSADTIYFRQARSMQELAKKDFENLRQDSDDGEPQPKVVRRGRPPGKSLKRSLDKSPLDRVGPESTSDASLATGGDNASWSNGYNLRKPNSYKSQPADAVVRASHGSHNSETYNNWSSEWENEFPASVLRAVLKHGKKQFALDENKRDTYKLSLVSELEPSSVMTTLEGELKQLIAVGVNVEYGYARSLARFAADLGPVVWKIASKKIESILPTGLEFGPGWVGENEAVNQWQYLSPERRKFSNISVSEDTCSVLPSGTNTMASRCSSQGREEMVESVGGFAGVTKPASHFQIQQAPIVPSDMGGFSGVSLGFNCSPQMGMAKLGTPTGQSGLDHGGVPSQVFGMVPGSNLSIYPVHGNDCNSNEAKFVRNFSGLHSGNPLLHGSVSKLDTMVNVGAGGRSAWRAMPSYHTQDFQPCPPDLNVGFLVPGSTSSKVHIGSPPQPDLALQL